MPIRDCRTFWFTLGHCFSWGGVVAVWLVLEWLRLDYAVIGVALIILAFAGSLTLPDWLTGRFCRN